MSMNRVYGTQHRQKLKSQSGIEIHRGYLYLTPDAWNVLGALCTAAGLPTSKYIATLINAANGQSDKKEKHNESSST